ncbi:MAG: type II toxin-antitoxin system HicB family antitoxin [Candidatus Latescibacterota bacterium]
MQHRGYTAVVAYDDRDRVFHGHLADTYDDVYFEGQSVKELEGAFREAVDDYLAYCAEQGRQPTKPFSGRLNVRLEADLHRRLSVAARRRGVSLNQFVIEVLTDIVD